jgi:endoglucanase
MAGVALRSVGASLAILLAAGGAPADTVAPALTAFIRVDQVGYQAATTKIGFVLATADLEGEPFRVETTGGTTVLTGSVGADVGPWNDQYDFVGRIDLTSVTAVGTYRVKIDSPSTVSPWFRVAAAENLYTDLAKNARAFFAAQRDGEDVVAGALDRQPAHLNDATATSYDVPNYHGFDLVGDLDPVGGPVDVEGGWFDAGDYMKFVQTTSYADALLLAAARDAPGLLGPGGTADLSAELRHGTDWLLKMWDDDSRTLYYQVGIGDGNGCGSICADHDIWRLPERDDTYGGGASKYRYIRERPAFRAAPAGDPVSPNLAGRLAASFGLCSQVFRSSDAAYADRCLQAGQRVYALADTSWQGKLLTVSPHGYYPESSWHDDLELGATQLALALLDSGAQPDPAVALDSPQEYVAAAATAARGYLRKEKDDSLNLYDVSGLAHVDLHRAIDLIGGTDDLAVRQSALRKDLRRQLDAGARQADRDPFGVGYAYGFDVASHLFGLVATAVAYDELTGSDQYADLATAQLGAVFGANAWGTSLVVGAGSTFPNCMQHQVANLKGSRDGSDPLLLGAVVNGPNDPRQFHGLGLLSDARACPPDGGDVFKQFTGQGGRYLDDVRAWPAVEPAIDFTATSMLALAHVVAAAG